MIFPLFVSFFISLTDGYQVPFCFKPGIVLNQYLARMITFVGVTWNSAVSGGIQSVETPSECQRICADSNECDSVTWYSGVNSPHGDYCEPYSSPDSSKEVLCDNCTSGQSF